MTENDVLIERLEKIAAIAGRRIRVESSEREIAELRAERDARLAYAALLLMRATIKPDGSEWTPEEAVSLAAIRAVATADELSAAGWGASEVADLMNCRYAAKVHST